MRSTLLTRPNPSIMSLRPVPMGYDWNPIRDNIWELVLEGLDELELPRCQMMKHKNVRRIAKEEQGVLLAPVPSALWNYRLLRAFCYTVAADAEGVSVQTEEHADLWI